MTVQTTKETKPGSAPAKSVPTMKPRANTASPADFELNVGGMRYNQWFYSAPNSITLADLERPEFWVHLANRLNANDVIDAVSQSGTFDCQYRVLGKMGHLVHLAVLRELTNDPTNLPVTDEQVTITAAGYRVGFVRGEGWRVVAPDNSIVSSGHLKKEMAEATMHESIAEMRRKRVA